MTPAPALVRARVRHRRTRPFTYELGHRTTMWLVDAADPDAGFPRWLRALASIRAEDHFAATDPRPLPAKVRSFLDAQGLSWSAHRVLVLANARSLGYVFDPLTTYFCLDADGRLEGVLAEVHNTYGERHCYPLEVTETRGASVDKEFYVSPFFAVEGRYDIRTRLTDSRVAVAVTLTQGGEQVFTASVHGGLEPATRSRVLRAVAADPMPSQRVSALIRFHGVRLWLHRLPVVPRRPHQSPRGMRNPA
ncbi:MAG: DUF1365 domain-containing protein [Nocardioidaceae bacterium]|nr:DUF1365 domain-containing protein [Nocardioidaceae bacterium]NUS50008.1 DUF1365 domain-containing protein [Nocardioidaceae bacterium]